MLSFFILYSTLVTTILGLYINQFFPRPGTPAAAMDKVNAGEVKKRTKALSEVFKSYEPHRTKIGRIYTVLACEEATDKIHYAAHNKQYVADLMLIIM